MSNKSSSAADKQDDQQQQQYSIGVSQHSRANAGTDEFSPQPSKPKFDRRSSSLRVGWYKTKVIANAARRFILPDPSAHDWITMGRHMMLATFLIIVILLIGAASMESLERHNELLARAAFIQADALLQQRLSAAEYLQVTSALNYGTLQPFFLNDKWDFKGSMFFTLTIITSIGYGNYAPGTPQGKLFVLFYGTLGIVCMAYSLFIIAETTLAGTVYLYGRIHPNRATWRVRTRLIFCASFGVVLIVIGGGVFSSLEGYSYIDSAYFSWGTLLTVGLGDIVPQQSASRTVLGIYMVCGLGIISTLIDYVVESTAPSPRGLPTKAEHTKIQPPPPLELPDSQMRAHLGDRDEHQELELYANAAAKAGVDRADQAIKRAQHAASSVRLRLKSAESLDWHGWQIDTPASQHQTAKTTVKHSDVTVNSATTSYQLTAYQTTLNEKHNLNTSSVADTTSHTTLPSTVKANNDQLAILDLPATRDNLSQPSPDASRQLTHARNRLERLPTNLFDPPAANKVDHMQQSS